MTFTNNLTFNGNDSINYEFSGTTADLFAVGGTLTLPTSYDTTIRFATPPNKVSSGTPICGCHGQHHQREPLPIS